MHYWEYNSTNLSDGKPVDVRQRRPESKQPTREKDAETIANYSNPTYVLGWTPAMAPLILAPPEAVMMGAGQSMTISVKVAAIPDATYQWRENGAPIQGETNPTLARTGVKPADAARYTVTVTNAAGSATSVPAVVVLK